MSCAQPFEFWPPADMPQLMGAPIEAPDGLPVMAKVRISRFIQRRAGDLKHAGRTGAVVQRLKLRVDGERLYAVALLDTPTAPPRVEIFVESELVLLGDGT